MDYYQGKANRALDTFSQFLQKSNDKEKKFQAENSQIFYGLQFSLTNASLSGLFILSNLILLH